MVFLGFSAGLPFLLVFSTLSAWLSEAGVERSAIGFFSWVLFGFFFGFFWVFPEHANRVLFGFFWRFRLLEKIEAVLCIECLGNRF